MTLPFSQVDVFTDSFTQGNPVAVVHEADDVTDEQMAAFARWTNLSETTFLLAPTDDRADYRVRIFTPGRELPFAGHPTLGTARAWLEAGGQPADPDTVVQECAAGLVRVRRDGERLAFAAPPLLREGPVEPALLEEIIDGLDLGNDQVIDARWCDNGPGWVGLHLEDAATVLAIDHAQASFGEHDKIGVIGAHPKGSEVDFEVRAFFSQGEDPVTGSLNAAFGQWLIGEGIAPDSYVAAQGTVMQRTGRVHVQREADDIWVGGHTVIGVAGSVQLP